MYHTTNMCACHIIRAFKQELEAARNRNKILEAELAELRKDSKCKSCANRGKADGLTQETYCDSCIYADSWRRNNYNAMKEVK